MKEMRIRREYKEMREEQREYTCSLALVSRIDTITGLFCKRALLKKQNSAKETCNFKKPSDRRQPIAERREYKSRVHTSL